MESLLVGFKFFQVFAQKRQNVFELGDVLFGQVHQIFMSLEHGFGGICLRHILVFEWGEAGGSGQDLLKLLRCTGTTNLPQAMS